MKNTIPSYKNIGAEKVEKFREIYGSKSDSGRRWQRWLHPFKHRAMVETILTENAHLSKMNEVKDSILAILRHDAKTPLQGISGYSGMLQDDSLTLKEKKEIRTWLMENVQSLLKILNSLSAWSETLRAGRQVETASIGLRECVSDAVLECRPQAEEKGVRLSANGVPAELRVLSDNNALQMILRNLMSNAIKFTGNGGTVEVLASKNNGNIEISVKDSGVGMSKEQIEGALGSKGNSTRGTSGEAGTGLGIPMILYVLVELLGREPPRIESQLGAGTTISFSLPAADEAPNPSS